MKTIDQMTQSELLSLPQRKWDEVKRYEAIVVVPTGRKHDSGFHIMALVGCNASGTPIEVAGFCDDIAWKTRNTEHGFRCDMFHKSRCVRFHSSEFAFFVGPSLSTIEITVVKKHDGTR